MEKFGKFVLKIRIPIIVLTGLLTVFFSFQLRKIRIESDLAKYLKQSAPEVKLFNYIGEKFGGNEIVLVALKTDNIFTYKNLTLLEKLTNSFSNIKGVASVTSLTNIIDIRKSDEGLEVTNLLGEGNIPRDRAYLKHLKEYVLGKDMYRGKIISPDGKIALIIVRLGEAKDRIKVAKKIKRITFDEISKSGLEPEVYFSGLPMQMIEVNDYIIKDLKRLIPIVSIVVMIVLFLGLHNLRGVLLPLLIVAVSVVWTIGLMAALHRPLSVISNILPVLLIAIGTAYSIHFISRYREETRNGDTRKTLLDTFRGVGIPIILSGLTTIAGFISFAGAYLVSVTDFGIFSAFGVFTALLLSLTLLPAIISLFPPPSSRFRYLESGSKFLEKIIEPAAKFVVRNEKLILSLGFIVFILGVIGTTKIKTSVNLLDYFPKNSDLRRSERIFQEYFGGSIPIQIYFKGNLKNPAVLSEMYRLEKYLRHLDGVNNPQSLASLITEENFVMNNVREIPLDRESVANLLFMLEGQDVLDQMVDPKYTEGIVQARFSRPETHYIVSTVDSIEHFIQRYMVRDGTICKREDIPDSLKSIIDSILISRVTQEIKWDIHFRTGKNVSIETIVKILRTPPNQQLTQSDLKKLRRNLFEYFYNEFDIELKKDVARAISDEITNTAKNNTFSAKRFRSILEKHIQKLDNETINDAYSYVSSLIRTTRKMVSTRELTYQIFEETGLKPDKRLVEDIEGDIYQLFEDQIYVPAGIVKGKPFKFEAINNGFLKIYDQFHLSLLKSQKQSFILAFILVTVLVSLQLSSIFGGIIGIIPILLVVAFVFFIMGFAGIPLDNATMMIAAIVIGIGIDYVIHFTSRFRKEIASGLRSEEALEKTLLTTGKAIYLNALTVGLGFLVLIFAELIPLRTFGWMVALTMFLSAIFATTILPALILTERKLKKGGR